jgi:hypothetical protein
MTGLGAVLVAVGAWHALFIASNREGHARGMHALVWGSAFVIAGRVK